MLLSKLSPRRSRGLGILGKMWPLFLYTEKSILGVKKDNIENVIEIEKKGFTYTQQQQDTAIRKAITSGVKIAANSNRLKPSTIGSVRKTPGGLWSAESKV